MFSRSAKVFGAVAAVELVVPVLTVFALTVFALTVFALAAGWFGVLLLLLVVAAFSACGSTDLFRQTAGMGQQATKGVMSPDPGATAALGDRSLRIAGGALLAFPGLPTGLIGGLLLVPPVRNAIRPAIGNRLSRLVPAEPLTTFSNLDRTFRRPSSTSTSLMSMPPKGPSPVPIQPTSSAGAALT